MIDWQVFARQIALVLIPVVLAKLNITESLALVITGPLADVAATVIVTAGFAVVGWVVWLGQRREKPKAKIEEAVALMQTQPDAVQDAVNKSSDLNSIEVSNRGIVISTPPTAVTT